MYYYIAIPNHHVNHHAGGLEKIYVCFKNTYIVNHHAGGLEMHFLIVSINHVVNHHAGGLERSFIFNVPRGTS